LYSRAGYCVTTPPPVLTSREAIRTAQLLQPPGPLTQRTLTNRTVRAPKEHCAEDLATGGSRLCASHHCRRCQQARTAYVRLPPSSDGWIRTHTTRSCLSHPWNAPTAKEAREDPLPPPDHPLDGRDRSTHRCSGSGTVTIHLVNLLIRWDLPLPNQTSTPAPNEGPRLQLLVREGAPKSGGLPKSHAPARDGTYLASRGKLGKCRVKYLHH
jgi:hypothetical protein